MLVQLYPSLICHLMVFAPIIVSQSPQKLKELLSSFAGKHIKLDLFRINLYRNGYLYIFQAELRGVL